MLNGNSSKDHALGGLKNECRDRHGDLHSKSNKVNENCILNGIKKGEKT